MDRLKNGLRKAAFANPLYRLTLRAGGIPDIDHIPHDLWPGNADHGCRMINNQFSFAGHHIESSILPWEPNGNLGDWVPEMHSFEWLRDLRAMGGDIARRKARQMISNWIVEYGAWHPTVWRTDVLGRRIAAWVGFYNFVCGSADERFEEEMLISLSAQARHLLRVFPGHLDGIERLYALKGVLYTHVCLGVSSVSEERVQRLIENETTAQIWHDGVHISRNPAIHMRALMDFIDIRNLLNGANVRVSPLLTDVIRKMAKALKFFRHSDNRLATLSGGCEEQELMIDTIIMQSGYKGKVTGSMKQSGYGKISGGRATLFFDIGPAGPCIKDWNSPGAFELGIGKQRLFVNCGNTKHQSGWTDPLNRTAAFSTLSINEDDADFSNYGSLDVEPCDVQFHDIKNSKLIEMTHSGFYKKHETMHQRRIYMAADGSEVRGEDVLTGPAGNTYTVRFHLHPNVKASMIQDGYEVLLQISGKKGWRFLAGGHFLRLEESVYLGDGKNPRRCLQIVMEGQTIPDKTALQWVLQPEQSH